MENVEYEKQFFRCFLITMKRKLNNVKQFEMLLYFLGKLSTKIVFNENSPCGFVQELSLH